ncbi:MAG TPA: hypothetical protein VMI31_17010 [Fimbriimonadaceae bacterium]|nr:hypothetical protein [Fimbriimonadaceae bacterium]
MPDEPDEDVDDIERELEKRLREFRLHEEDEGEKSRFPEPPTDEEIEARMQDMRDKVSQAGRSRMPEPPELKVDRPKMLQKGVPDHGYHGLGIGMTAAYALVGMMAAGFGIGWLLDHGPHSAGFGPAFGGLAGCVAGIAFVFWLINRPK